MFEQLQKRLGNALQKVRGRSTISEKDVDAVLSEIRTGLLEADIHFRVAKDFLARVKERCLREDVIKSLKPEEQIVKVLSDELTEILGGSKRELNLDVKTPAVLLLCGLQGSGKTTSASKLARLIKDDIGKRVCVVSVDVYRPAAMDQLKYLSQKLEISVLNHDGDPEVKPQEITRRALKEAKDQNFEVLIIDTAGRLQIDDDLMKELKEIEEISNPSETLLVVDAMMGQQAVEVADGFGQSLELSGAILTKLDGDARGGAALSLVSVTGKPIKYVGLGERPEDFEVFHPERMASRLLDMGDILSLVERAEKVISQEDAQAAAEKMANMDSFNFEDFRNQMKMVSKMGPMTSLFKMLPGFGQIQDQLQSVDTDKELKRVDAIISSMTPEERRRPEMLNGSRRSRIARGAGTEVQEVNQLIKRFLEARKMMKKLGGLGKMFGGNSGAGEGPNMMKNLNPKGRRGKGFGRKL